MAFSPGASTNHIFCAKKYAFLTIGLGLRLLPGEGWLGEGTQG